MLLILLQLPTKLAWEISRRFAMPPLVSLWNDVWEMSMEIPSWWHVTTQIWVVLLNGCDPREILLWPIRSTAHIWLVTRHQYRISPLIPQLSFCGKTSGGFAKCRLFSQVSTKLSVTAQWSKGVLEERLQGALKFWNPSCSLFKWYTKSKISLMPYWGKKIARVP